VLEEMIKSLFLSVEHVDTHPCAVQPCPIAQAFPQLRQLAGSIPRMSAQYVPASVPHVVQPAAHAGMAHPPSKQA
jgi:hypothetical protein